MREPRILSLDDPRALRPECVGAKAANLARLRQADLPCPPGFCVTAGALEATLGRGPTGLGLAPDLADAVAAALAGLALRPGERVAVRSSSMAEDGPASSFAGIFESLLDVELAGVPEAIARCWASFFAERARSYGASGGGGVIVQRMIPAEVAGVAFTADPVTGDRGQILLNAAPGRGDRTASGAVTPAEYRLARNPLEGAESLRLIDTRAGEDGPEVLSEAAAVEIATLALRAERLFGCPQDVEWARHGGRTFVLQSRPISTLGHAISGTVPPGGCRAGAGPTIWSNANLKEILPGVMTPLTWSFLQRNMRPAWERYYTELDYRLPEECELFRPIAGRLYFNVSAFQRILHEVYGAHPEMENRAMGGHQAVAFDPARVRNPLGLRLRRLRRLLRMKRLLAALPDRAAREFAEVRDWSARRQGAALAAAPDAALAALLRDGEAFSLPKTALHLLITDAAGAILHLEGLLQRWLPREEWGWINRLLTGLNDMKTAEQGVALWTLAHLARGEPLAAAFLAAEGWREADYRTALAGTRFLEAFDAFLDAFGHRGPNELELASPSWREDQTFLFAAIRSHLSAGGGPEATDPGRLGDARAAERRAATERIARRLVRPWHQRLLPLRRRVFLGLLPQVQVFTALRENSKHHLMMLQSEGRRVLREVGARWARRGVLVAAEDLYFLKAEEVLAILEGKAEEATFAAPIARRRAEHRAHEAAAPADVFVEGGEGAWGAGPPDPGLGVAGVLAGIAVSPGRIVGPARVLRTPAEASRLGTGEILVVPALDPAWTPLLLVAGGLVTEVGGVLSHGAIVAREYGIPAVVNVRGASREIRDGERIVVDGWTGTVQRAAT